MSIIDSLNNLQNNLNTAKQVLVDNISAKGVSVTTADTLTDIANSVLDIPQEGGGGTVVGDAITDWSTIGYEEVPQSVNDGWTYAKQIYDNWDSSITYRNQAFKSDTQLVYFPAVDTSNVTDMGNMLNGCNNLLVFPKNIDTSNVIQMYGMLQYCYNLPLLDVSNWDTSKVTSMSRMLYSCRSLTSLDLSSLNISNVTSLESMFYDCNKLTSIDLSGWDTSKVTDMSNMFQRCTVLTSIDLSGWDLNGLGNYSGFNSGVYGMFDYCNALTSINLNNVRTSNVTNMGGMFRGCSGLTSLDVSSFDTSNVTNMGSMFNGCTGLTSLDLSSFDTSNVTNMDWMFGGCHRLQKIGGYLDWTQIKTYPSNFITTYSSYGYPLRYMTIKNLGTTGTTFNFNNDALQNWGDETDTTTYPLSVGARQSLIDSLITYSFDRVAAGYATTCTITLHSNTMARLTEEEIAQITSKGYTLA